MTQVKKVSLRERLFRRQSGRCYYCAQQMVLRAKHIPGKPQPDNLCTLEHIEDRWSERRGDPHNKNVVACRACNNARGAERERAIIANARADGSAPPPEFTEEDAEPVSEDQLRRIRTLGELLLIHKAELAKAQDAAKTIADNVRKIEERDLPEAMAAAGMRDFTLLDGTAFEINEEIYTSITEANRAAAFKWLRENNFDAIIRRVVAVKFGKGDDEAATALLAELKKKLGEKFELVDTEAVHPQTLKAFVRECYRDGVAIPETTFGVHKVNRATIIKE